MGLFGPRPEASLKFGFPQRDQVQILDQSVLGITGQPPACVVYPFLMAGKLFFNFGDSRARSAAREGAERIRHRLDATDGQPSLLSVCSGGNPEWVEGRGARFAYRADFIRVSGAPVLIPQTHFPNTDEDYYHRLTIGACIDLAAHRAGERGREVAEAAESLLLAIATHGVPNPQAPVMLAYAAAAAVYDTAQ